MDSFGFLLISWHFDPYLFHNPYDVIHVLLLFGLYEIRVYMRYIHYHIRLSLIDLEYLMYVFLLCISIFLCTHVFLVLMTLIFFLTLFIWTFIFEIHMSLWFIYSYVIPCFIEIGLYEVYVCIYDLSKILFV
jgi:hypothetical protein